MAKRRASRPLPVSKELLTSLRLCEGVALSGLLPDDVLEVAESPGHIRAENIDYTEKEIGHPLPDELLSLIAIGHPVAALVTGIRSLGSLVEAAEEEIDLEGVDDDKGWFPISVVYSEPLAEAIDGAHGGPHLTLCVRPGKEVPLPVLVLGGADGPNVLPLGSMITEMLRDELSRIDPDTPIKPNMAYQPPDPTVTDEPTPKVKPQAQRKVRHKKFGEGMVVASEGTGPEARLTIEFASVGTKKLVASFVEDA